MNKVEIDRSKAIEIFILLSSVYILCAAIHHGVFTTLQLLRALHWCWVTSARVWLNCFCKVIPTTCHRFNFYRENSDPSTLLAKITLRALKFLLKIRLQINSLQIDRFTKASRFNEYTEKTQILSSRYVYVSSVSARLRSIYKVQYKEN